MRPEPVQVPERIIITVNRVNELLQTFDDCRIENFDGCRLLVITDWDLSYHHNLEIIFIEAGFIQCATYFNTDVFRLATDDERVGIAKKTYLEPEEIVFCIESDGRTYFIVALDIEIKEGLVLHYTPAPA